MSFSRQVLLILHLLLPIHTLNFKKLRMKYLTIIFLPLFVSVSFVSCAQKVKTTEAQNPVTSTGPAGNAKQDLSKYKQATFAAGCFWCEEAVFESVKGVQEVISGYAGGQAKNPTYEQVETGTTGHAESVNVYYDSTVIDYPTLLKVYFASEDPIQVNGQGPDIGTQYRSIIFYRNDTEKKLAEDYIAMLNKSGKYSSP